VPNHSGASAGIILSSNLARSTARSAYGGLQTRGWLPGCGWFTIGGLLLHPRLMVMNRIIRHRTRCFASLSMTASEVVTLSEAKGLWLIFVTGIIATEH